MLTPHHYYRSIHDIDLADLRRCGVTTLLVDLDNTLLVRNSEEATESARAWAARAVGEGMQVCIVSNNWHDRVFGVADAIGLPIEAKALKPLPGGFRRALRRLDVSAEGVAVVGDQVFTDILGGRLAGFTTVLVQPLSTSDLPHTRVLRFLERLVLAKRRPLP